MMPAKSGNRPNDVRSRCTKTAEEPGITGWDPSEYADGDRANLTGRARQIIAEAATTTSWVQTIHNEMQNNADRSGAPTYSWGLSLRRVCAVAAELVRCSVSQAAINGHGRGDTNRLVPTLAGVREP